MQVDVKKLGVIPPRAAVTPSAWAYVRLFLNNAERRRALPRWVRFYNQRRPHSELGNQPPWTVFVNKVRGNHS